MPPSTPFVDPQTGALDAAQIIAEAIPLAKLVGSFAALAFVPFAIAFAVGGSVFGAMFSILGQFVLAVGTGVVLIYVIARAIWIASE